VLKLDDTLRHRTDKLQAQLQAILTDIARLKKRATVPAYVLQTKHIDAKLGFDALVELPICQYRAVDDILGRERSNDCLALGY
jgi:hypothetical protein